MIRILILLIFMFAINSVALLILKRLGTNLKQYRPVLFGEIVIFILFCIAMVFTKGLRKPQGTFVDGYIIAEGEKSSLTSNLFYQYGDRYMIDVRRLDKLLNLDVMERETGCIIRTSKNQIEVTPDEQTYTVNLNVIKEDDSYLIPFVSDDAIYADTERIFEVFGYSTEYQSNGDHSIVELLLTKIDGDPYETITLYKKTFEIQESEKQIEEDAVITRPEISQPGESELPTIPRPTEAFSEEKFLEEGGVYPDDIQEIIDNRPIEKPNLPQVIERPEEGENRKTDEEFQEIWKESKSEMAKVFQSGSASTGTIPYVERTEDFIAFNPMNKAIYYDTISVLHDVDEETFMEVTISSEWSDMALNTDNAESIAFYQCIPRMVEAAIKYSIGENAGTELYNWIKTHADKTVQGGYIASHNEYGEVVAVWTDGEVGDGIRSTELDFESWRDKTTDNGLRYYAARNGDGIVIKVYKN